MQLKTIAMHRGYVDDHEVASQIEFCGREVSHCEHRFAGNRNGECRLLCAYTATREQLR